VNMNNRPDLESRLKGGLWGVVVGDAFGFPFQFWSRKQMKERYPDPKDIPMRDGLWSDDSSLTLATAHALKDGYSLERIAENFINWYYDGEFTPRGYPFDEGITTSRAIELLAEGISPLNAGGRGERERGGVAPNAWPDIPASTCVQTKVSRSSHDMCEFLFVRTVSLGLPMALEAHRWSHCRFCPYTKNCKKQLLLNTPDVRTVAP